MTTSRKGISSLQLAREIGVTQKTTWFVLGRLRKAAEQTSSAAETLPGPVEADESYFGGKNRNRHERLKHPGRGPGDKMAVAGVLSRTSGHVAAQKIEYPDAATLIPFVEGVTETGATVYTDEARAYDGLPACSTACPMRRSTTVPGSTSEGKPTRTGWSHSGRCSSGGIMASSMISPGSTWTAT